jgi:REP element-mobilizing transposase RayT
VKNLRRKALRLPEYDYSSPGAYFVTICTFQREFRLGKVIDGIMQISEEGLIVEKTWAGLIDHYYYVMLDELIVMPNHVHGILFITENPTFPVGAGLRPAPTRPDNRCGLSELVRALKSFSAREINKLNGTPGAPFWQRGYYEHIIRDEESLNLIRGYIADNPQQLSLDHENPDFRGNNDFPFPQKLIP